MKFGCCLNMVSTKPDGTGAEWIAELKNSGFDYAELPLSQMMDLSEDDFDQIRNQLLEVGIPCDGCNNFFPASIRLTGEEADYQGFAEVLRKIGYDGRISCEASAPEGFRKDAPLTREFSSELFEKG
jgi:D-psicose/D-tagatose/L-ribulose 3-epimerase